MKRLSSINMFSFGAEHGSCTGGCSGLVTAAYAFNMVDCSGPFGSGFPSRLAAAPHACVSGVRNCIYILLCGTVNFKGCKRSSGCCPLVSDSSSPQPSGRKSPAALPPKNSAVPLHRCLSSHDISSHSSISRHQEALTAPAQDEFPHYYITTTG